MHTHVAQSRKSRMPYDQTDPTDRGETAGAMVALPGSATAAATDAEARMREHAETERAMAVMVGEDPPAEVALLSSASMAPRPAGGTTKEAHTATTDDERAPRTTTYTERATAHLTRESRQKVRRYRGYYDCTFVALVGTLTGGLCEEARRGFEEGDRCGQGLQ